jgi:tetratricopeptide (TPR) repeat protein
MTTWRRAAWLAVCLALVSAAGASAAGGRATVREYRRVIRTYPFSDPNPIPQVGRIYPYFRFDGYTNHPADGEWTVVELENDYLRVTILPEIGGKIWSAVERSTGRSFIYDNHVVKFRDIAMRGPWTSGGIEPNYGIIGHTPNCATPVDYVTRVNPDGSASVVIGVLDLLTRTSWRLEITLPADRAYFTTRSFWYNGSGIEQPYYSWMNAGIKAAGNLELVYPGSVALGHAGEVGPWPINPANGKDIAFYEQNDFGSYKSYHVFGRETDFFGAYWHDDDFGMGHYARRDDKLGKKAWIWGLSRQGMIWEKLLTDTDGQYVEVQSGRLFNQAAEGSTFTPFKHRGFAPHSTDTWTEYWFPVKGTGGFVKANEHGALNVVWSEVARPGAGGGAAPPAAPAKAARLVISFSPLEAVDDTLEVLQDDTVVYSARLALKPMQTWSQAIDRRIPAGHLRVRIGRLIDYRPVEGDQLSRPLESPKDFDWNSVQGLHIQGREWLYQREYGRAQASLEACLRKDPNYVPALADLAMLRYRAMDYQGAWDLARRGLAIDTYDPGSNYDYGLASVRLGRTADAQDGFEVAAQTPEYRSAAWTELAKLHLAKGDTRGAEEDASRSVDADPMNLDGYRVLAVLARIGHNAPAAEIAARRNYDLNPLDHFVRAEAYLDRPTPPFRQALVDGVRHEMPHETFLELAAWYRDVGRLDDARRVLEAAPREDEVLYWLAFVRDALHDPAAAETLRRADAASARLVFPFRSESAPVFEWAMGRTANWRPRYYLALIHWSRGNTTRALDLLNSCGDTPDFAPLFAARAELELPAARDRSLADLAHAAALDPSEWRYGRLLAERAIADGTFEQALAIAAKYAAAAPENSVLGLLHARTLLLTRRFAEAAGLLDRLDVLPHEGATEAHGLYREAQLMVAVQEMKAERFDAALKRIAAAREWPEHLGVGKPYPADTDERLEDYLEAQCLAKQGRSAEADALLAKLAAGGRPNWPDGAAADLERRVMAEWIGR